MASKGGVADISPTMMFTVIKVGRVLPVWYICFCVVDLMHLFFARVELDGRGAVTPRTPFTLGLHVAAQGTVSLYSIYNKLFCVAASRWRCKRRMHSVCLHPTSYHSIGYVFCYRVVTDNTNTEVV